MTNPWNFHEKLVSKIWFLKYDCIKYDPDTFERGINIFDVNIFQQNVIAEFNNYRRKDSFDNMYVIRWRLDFKIALMRDEKCDLSCFSLVVFK